MTNAAFADIIVRFRLASSKFERVLRSVKPDMWALPTPCAEWNVRQLTNHQARANLNFALLAEGGSREEFIEQRDVDALGDDPVVSFARSAHACANAFEQSGALDAQLDYPLGPLSGRQALALRTTDSTIHTWDLARAIGADELLDAVLVTWIVANLDVIYAGLPEMPDSSQTTHRFFAPPVPGDQRREESLQDALLRKTGRDPR